jgi:predicted MFS family arabinose efflux permease
MLRPMHDMPVDQRATERRRVPALLTGYWAFGQYWGIWVILVVQLQSHHDLTYGEMGLLLALLSGIAMTVMTFVTPRLARFPLGLLCAISLCTLGVGSTAMALLPAGALWIAFAIVGAGNGLIDVFLNIEGQRVESVTRRPVLQWLHAMYAVGGITGAAIAGLVAASGTDYRIGLLFGAAALFLAAFWNADVGTAERGATEVDSGISLSAFRRHPALWLPAIVVLSAFLVEGSMDTWSGLYLKRQLGATDLQTALAFVAFSTSVAIGRLLAGRVLFGLGRRTTIIVSGTGGVIGGAIAAIANDPALVAVGFLLMGGSIAAAAPAGFGLVESVAPDDRAHAIAAVTTVGYSGFVWSPPIFAWLAGTFDLRAAMAVIVSATVGIVLAGLVAPRDRLVPAHTE